MTTHKHLALFHNVRDKHALLVGGGVIATRRCEKLLDHGMSVHVVAAELSSGLKELLQVSGNSYQEEAFKPEHLEKVDLVVAATNNSELNAEIAAQAKQQNVLVNVVDAPDLCDVLFPSIVERGPLSIAVSSNGASPMLSRTLKGLLEGLIPTSYGRLAELAGRFRSQVKDTIKEEAKRRTFWRAVMQGAIAEAMFSGKESDAEDLMKAALQKPDEFLGMGEVYLIGAGPGDPGLLTLRAFRLIQQADVVLYDRLVSKDIMDMIKPETELVYVGKKRSDHAVPQQQINELLVEHAQQGKRVARLKGGDPFIFGRGGEEIETLSDYQIPFQVIPGITAASGCAAYSGIPLTHRDHAQSVRFVTGQLKDGSVDLPWHQLVDSQQTVVFYMGLMGLPVICEQLIENGASADLPAALVEKGTTAEQRIHLGSLGTLPKQVADKEVRSPTLLVVGSVVSLHSKLSWFNPE